VQEKEKQYHKMDVQTVLEDLKTNRKGITKTEAFNRRALYGLNELPRGKKTSIFKLFFDQFKDILILILIVAIIINLIVIIFQEEKDFTDVIAITVFIMINSTIGLVTEYRSEKSMLALQKITADTARVIRPDGEEIIDSRFLVPGDVIHLEMGDKVPADVRLIEVMNLQINESSLTGESNPVKKITSAITEAAALGDRYNTAYNGTVVTYGRGKGVVTATGLRTQIGKIAQLLSEIEEADTPLQRKMARVGVQLGTLIIVFCVLVFVIGILKAVILETPINSELIIGLMLTSVALAVAAMPSGLPIVITTLLALGMYDLANERALVKRLRAVETLGSVNVICSDKTGTLTKNEMTSRKIYANGKLVYVSGVGYIPKGEFKQKNEQNIQPLDDIHFELLFRIGILCGTTTVEEKDNQWIVIGDPTEGSLITLGMKAGLDPDALKEQYPQIGEIPFTSELKRMTTIHKTPDNTIHAYVKGAPDIILERCNSIFTNGKIQAITEETRAKILKLNEELSSQQLRVLAMAYTELNNFDKESYDNVDTDLTFVGFVGMLDPPREEVPEAIEICRRAGIDIKMITGDHPATANAIAREIGLISEEEIHETIVGVDFYHKSKGSIEYTKVFARISPEHKLRVVEALLEKDYIVAVTGDGVNDAPALKSANIGVAMGIAGTDVAKEAAHMTLTDDNFATIVSAVRKGRNIYENILKTIFYLLSCNIGEILVIFVWIIIGSNIFNQAWIPTILPLFPLQILWINLITDALPALSLAREPEDPRLMQKPPRKVNEPVFTPRFTINIIILGSLICFGSLLIFHWGLARGVHMWGLGSEVIEKQIYRYATTLVFMTVTFFENWNIYCSRSLNDSIFKIKTQNYYMHLALVVAIILQATVVYIPSLNSVFHTFPLGVIDWLFIIGISSSIVWVTEIYKKIWVWIDKRKVKREKI